MMRKELALRRYRKLETEFREGIMTLSSAISAGYSPENAMKEAESELRMM
jgi:tight adherence protein B